MPLLFHYFYVHWNTPVQDLDLEIRRGGGVSKKKCFQPYGSQFGLKIRWGAGPPGPSPGSATVPSGSL